MTGEDTVFGLYEVVERLVGSEIYYSRLRRALINGWNQKVLTDFLVLDDLFGVIHRQFFLGRGEQPTLLAKLRAEVFAKALKSAERQLDVRDYPRLRKLAKYLLEFTRPEGTSAEQVFNAVYGWPKKGRAY